MSGLDDEESSELEGGDDTESTDEESGEADETFEEELEEEIEEDVEDDESSDYDEAEFDADEDLKVVDEVLSHKDQNARALAIRRAIEERLEAKRLSRDLDYLDLDLDADD